MTAVRAARPDIAEKAEKELNNYSTDRDGLQKLIKDKGGETFLNNAVDFANNAPRVRAMFDKFGVKPETLKDNVMKELQSNNQSGTGKIKNENPASSSLERLKKLR